MPSKPVSGGASVLVVEDNALVAAALDVWLSEIGYEAVRTVSTVQEAVHAALSLSPSVILMDLHLLGIGDGVDAAKQIHEAYGLACPVIFLTGDTSSDAVNRILQDHPAAILKKPVSETALRKTIDDVMQIAVLPLRPEMPVRS